MNRLVPALVPALLLALACATPPPPAPEPVVVAAPKPPPSPLPAPPQVIRSAFDADAAQQRIVARLRKNGFEFEAPLRPDPGAKPVRSIALSSRVLVKGPDTEPVCGGTTEVVQAHVERIDTGTILRIECYTAKLSDIAPGSHQCTQVPVVGCPVKGDRIVGEIALDAISSL